MCSVLYLLISVVLIYIIVTCTIPGFLHITGIKRAENINIVCLVLGGLLLLNVIYAFFFPCDACKNRTTLHPSVRRGCAV